MNYNKVILGGNLTRDPEMRAVGDTNVCKFGLAVNRKYKDKEDVTFIDCEAWGKPAELIGKHFGKGKPIFVEGRLKLDRWEAKDGTKQSALRVVVEAFQFVGGKPSGATTGQDEPPF